MKRYINSLAAVAAIACCILLFCSGPRSGAEKSGTSRPLSEKTIPIPSAEITPPIEPEPVPEKEMWQLSFAGDCTIGTLHEWQGMAVSSNMLYVMGEDYSYPFSGVADIFLNDDFTLVNLEGTFTNHTDPVYKDYRFRAPPEAAQVLTLGGVDAVTLANNHSGDYKEQGLVETRSALELAGIAYADEKTPLIMQLEGGLTLGVIAFNCVEIDLAVGDVRGYMERVTVLYEQCIAAQSDIIISYIHWGWEYRSEPEAWMEAFAHEMVDLGIDMVIGSHPHILQKTEVYEGVNIFYSLGNFCYGGHSAPADMDSVIVLQEIIRDGDYFKMGETRVLPCSISSDKNVNDFRPVPYAEGEPAYTRILEKLGLG